MKPILFNTEMVRAIQNGAKTATRRVVKPQPSMPYCHELDGEWFWTSKDADDDMMDWWPSYETGLRPPYQPGDILYVREAFWQSPDGEYTYRSDYNHAEHLAWNPSIHMPHEAARIFLRVTDVMVERLQDITHGGIEKEGIVTVGTLGSPYRINPFSAFKSLWDSTIKPADRALYGWEANPFVWAIEFERCGPQKGDDNED